MKNNAASNEPLHPAASAFFTVYCLSALASGAAACALLLAIPSDDKNSLVLGLSAQRLALLTMLLLPLIAFAAGAWFSLRRPTQTYAALQRLLRERAHPTYLGLLAALFLLTWTGSFLPLYQLHPYQAYFERLKPLIAWLAFLSGQSLLLVGLATQKLHPPRWWAALKSERRLWQAAVVTFALFLFLWALMAVTGLGITPDDRYWNEAGAPVLGLQVLPAWLISVAAGFFLLRRRALPGTVRKMDLVISLAVWVVAALLWTQTAMPRSYFAPGPYLPNQTYYPYSDAELNDLGAQYALIGQGLNNNQYFDKPFYMLLLTLFHSVAGQGYLATVQVQALFLALLPVWIYWIGKQLHSRAGGVLAAALIIFQQTNAIAATLEIQVSHSRLMMAEYPTAFGIAVLSLILIVWLKTPQPRSFIPLLAGGVLGILILTRPNSLLLLPWLILALILANGRVWRRALGGAAWLLLGAALVVGPWFLANRTPQGGFYMLEKFQAVFSTRYNGPPPETQPQPASTAILSSSQPPASTAIPSSSQPSAIAAASPTAPQPAPPTATPPTAGAGVPPAGAILGRIGQAMQFTPAHFFHNLGLSAFLLPVSLSYDDLTHTLQAAYWQIPWDGSLSPGAGILLALNLWVIAVGVGAAWRSARLAGLMPAGLLLSYFLANALGRTSGGRYLAPVDWIVLLYFALGLMQTTCWAGRVLGFLPAAVPSAAITMPPARAPRSTRLGQVLIAAALLLLGLSMVETSRIYPMRYARLDSDMLLQRALSTGALQQAGVSPQQLAAFLANDQAVILQGRALYPRFYGIGQGEPPSKVLPFYGVENYPRLIFMVIGHQPARVILPMPTPMLTFPDAADVIVLGCRAGAVVQAQALLIEGLSPPLLLRDPPANWQCPLPLPICNNNRICQ